MPSKFGGIQIQESVSKFGGVPIEPEQVGTQEQPISSPTISDRAQPAVETLQNIGRVYPALETAANIATSAYGIPLSGLAGLFQLTRGLGGIEKAGEAVEATQKALIYDPQTAGGKQLTGAVTAPFELLEKGGEAVAEPIAEAGFPGVATGVKTAITGAPAVVGAKTIIGKAPARVLSKIDARTRFAIRKGVKKGIRPTVVGKKTAGQTEAYFKRAETAVQEIIKNRENLAFLDDEGRVMSGELPKNLDHFSQAIEQTKKNIFEEYDGLSRQTDAAKAPVRIDLDKTATKLNPILDSKVLNDLSQETVQYAQTRIESLKGRKNYTALETQEAIQFLNQSLEKFYKDPSPQNKGNAMVDSLIANDLRTQLDNAISRTTGKEYGSLKKKYGALKTIEKEVAHRAVVDGRKNIKGLIDFSDILTGHQAVKGLLTLDPATMAGAGAVKGISKYIKWQNDPNTIIKTMFKDVEKLQQKQAKFIPRPNISEEEPFIPLEPIIEQPQTKLSFRKPSHRRELPPVPTHMKEILQAKKTQQKPPQTTPFKKKTKKSPIGTNVRTARGYINSVLGGINKGIFKGEVKELPKASKMLFKEKGIALDLAERQLKDEGFLLEGESLLEQLRNPEFLKRRPRNKNLEDIPYYELTKREKEIFDATKQETKQDISIGETIESYEKKGFTIIGGRDVSAGNLKKGDKIFAKIDGVLDEYTVKGENALGEIILQDGIKKTVDVFDKITIEAIKKKGIKK